MMINFFVTGILILENIFMVLLLFNNVTKQSLFLFYLSVIIALIVSIILHEMGHYLHGKINGYHVSDITIGPFTYCIEKKRVNFSVKNLAGAGHVEIDFAEKIIDKKTYDKVLLDVRKNLIMGQVFSIFLLFVAIILSIISTQKILFLCLIWINLNIIVSACMNSNAIQDIYGYIFFNKIRKQIDTVLICQIKDSKLSFLEKMVQENLYHNMKEKHLLEKTEVNQLIVILFRGKLSKKIFDYLLEHYSEIKPSDNKAEVLWVMFLLFFSTFICNNNDKFEVFKFADKFDKCIQFIKMPRIGYVNMYNKTQELILGRKIKTNREQLLLEYSRLGIYDWNTKIYGCEE